MSTAVREQCLSALYAVLQGIAGVKAFRNLTSLVSDADHPAVVLFDGGDDVSPSTSQTYQIRMAVDLEFYVSAASEDALGPALNALLAQVSSAIFADTSLGGAAIDITYTGMASPLLDKTEGGTPMIGAQASFVIEYQTDDRDLTRSGP